MGSAYTDAQWLGGDDRYFLKTLFSQIHAGSFGGLGTGVLNPHRLGASGYSVGAQMVSWLIQVQATGELTQVRTPVYIYARVHIRFSTEFSAEYKSNCIV